MTPDMKRLCDLARAEIPCPYDDEGRPTVSLDDRDEAAEAIVRAVLLALREPSESAAEAAGATCLPNPDDPYTPWIEIGSDAARATTAALINHILAEPAKA